MTKIKDMKIAIIAGTSDMLANVENTRQLRQTIKDTLVHYSEHELGHLSYFTADDMSYFSVTVMGLLGEYHPVSKEVLLKDSQS